MKRFAVAFGAVWLLVVLCGLRADAATYLGGFGVLFMIYGPVLLLGILAIWAIAHFIRKFW